MYVCMHVTVVWYGHFQRYLVLDTSGTITPKQDQNFSRNISDLVDYVLLSHNTGEAKPRVPNAFLDGLAELGINKRLIKNKKVLSDLLDKEQG